MKQKRRKFSPEFKTKVVLEALSERQSLTEIAQKHELRPNQVTMWKREFLDNASDVFSKGEKMWHSEQDIAQEKEQLFTTIGQLKVEVDWLKKNCSEQNPVRTTRHDRERAFGSQPDPTV
ncbi:MAG: transposase [Candidatus Chlorobium antarcticum]|jgi:transposase-like protein|nr:transposase [Candidatus Chlorobium antarcticum]